MKILKSFKLSNKLDTAKKGVKDFFGKLGFGVIYKGDHFEIIRGFKITNRYHSNPLNWKSRILIEVKKVNEGEVIIKGIYEIFPEPQLMDERDQQRWEEFIREFENYISGNKNSINEARKLLKRSNIDILKQIVLILSFGAIIGLLIGLISNTVKFDLTYIAIGLIPMAFLIYFYFDDRIQI